ncbi:hypothetical protein ACFL3T_04750 [Patescibacteria group bacterium]
MKKQNIIISLAALILALGGMTTTAYAQAEDLVNTESFFIIDDGADNTDIQLQFGDILGEILEFNRTNNRFEFTDDLYIQGTLESTGDLTVGGNIITSGTVDGVDVSDLSSTVTTNTGDITTLQGQSHNQNTDTGTTSNLFMLDNAGAEGNIDLQFGSSIGERIRWDDTADIFSISAPLYIDGTLEVNGNIDFNQNLATEMVLDQGGAFPGTPVKGQTFYRTDLNSFYIYDGSVWEELAANGPEAESIFLSPNYPHVTFFPDTSDNTGQLTYYFDDANIENAYKWTTSKNTIQDYDVKVRIQVPDNFADWDATTPIEFKYRTLTTAAADNQLDFTMLDSDDVAVDMTNNATLASGTANEWVELVNMTIDDVGEVWTPGDWFTVTIKLTAKNTGAAEAGSLVFNYDTN